MTVEATSFPLATEFPPGRYEDWLALVANALKGTDFEQRLVSRTHGGLRIEPLYGRAKHAEAIVGRRTLQPWQILQRVEHPDPAMAIEQARQEIEAGASGLSIVLAGALGARGYGLDASEATWSWLQESLVDARTAIELDLSPPVQGDLSADFARLVPGTAELRFGLDPLGITALNGGSSEPWVKTAAALAGLVQDLLARGFPGPFVVADARVIHDAGGAAAHELAFALASALTYLRAFEAKGVPLDTARCLIFFRLSADADQFVTMAKFRALRRLWARVEAALGVDPKPVFVSAEFAWRMMTQRDPWVNILRATVAAFAAGLAGANAITILPFTAALGLPDGFARRIARNTQLILIEESHLAKVSDPAAGSGGIEALTDALCGAAWSALQDIERVGGAVPALEAGLIQAKVAAVALARSHAVGSRRDLIIGTSAFSDIAEAKVAVLDAPRRPTVPVPTSFPPLTPHRLAEPFEALRDAADRMMAQAGSPPKVFLATLGPVSAFTEQAAFAKNFFEAGGIEAVSYDAIASTCAGSVPNMQAASEAPATDVASLGAAFRASGAALACLCCSERFYATDAGMAAQALASAGAKHIYLVGRPGNQEAALRKFGVETFIYPGADALGTLREAHAKLRRH